LGIVLFVVRLSIEINPTLIKAVGGFYGKQPDVMEFIYKVELRVWFIAAAYIAVV
jgi:hypothetical protein